jgi:Mrp family chromosome partitioning ATPase
MGRILEALTLPDLRQDSAPKPVAPDLHCVCENDAPTEDAEVGGEIPYIEVGPRNSMEASASVMATTPTRSTAPRLVAAPDVEVPKLPRIEPAPPPAEAKCVPPPRSRLAPELIAYHRPDHAVSQQYGRLIESLLGLAPDGRPQVLLFSCARPGAGTTTVLLNAAVAAARQGRRRVVVVDGNLRRPALAERLGLAEVGGLREVMAGSMSLERALRETDQGNLHALTAGKTSSAGGQAGSVRLVSETVRSLLRNLRQRFDLVLVDGPRWDGQQDVVLLGSTCDAVYLVVAEDEAESPQVDDLYQSIPAQGGRLAGCILAGC